MNKVDLISHIAQASGLKNVDAEKALDGFIAAVTQALKAGDEVRLLGFGTFGVTHRPASEGRNPRTGEKLAIAAKTVAKFRPGKGLKDAIA
jgi:DNA-binding protein HU-beta